jgi:integrase
VARRVTSINGLNPIFATRPVRQITHGDIQEWMRKRGAKLSARSYNLEIETLRLILDYCRDDLRIILEHPAGKLGRKKPSKRKSVIPTKEQFVILLKEMRSAASQNKSEDAADLVEGLAYSGCRLNETTEILWPHINWERETLRITEGELGTKNHEDREIPLFEPLKRLLRVMRNRETSAETDHVFLIKSAKKAITSACNRARLPHFTHHHFRHFFRSNAIEAGVDFKAIAEWLGHKDGGILVAKTYGYLRDDHSRAMARRITFDALSGRPEN